MVEEIKTKKFKCSICNKEYDYERDAEDCENKHKSKKREEAIEYAKNFTITEAHLKLLKQMNVSWDNCEYGAPCIDCKRPYGNSDVDSDIAEIIGVKKTKNNWDYDEESWSDKTRDELYWLHREMQVVLQIVLSTGQISTGDYEKKDDYMSEWVKCTLSKERG